MKVKAEKLEKEKQYLETVNKILSEKIKQDQQASEQRQNKINEHKKSLWKNMTDYNEEERLTAIYEVDKEVDRINISIADLQKYKKAANLPYFGKILFKNNISSKEFPVYVGIATVYEESKFYVFDWRAPIASMFYDYELGDAQYETPKGIIKGEITEKMQFKIENGQLIRCFENSLNIDDDYLQEVLANAKSEKLGNIVNTIQREQNAIIRNKTDKNLIVQGVAGSGKTTVALHRIAYLLYQNKELNAKNILFFSPNAIFSDYISSILPELGEENIPENTFSYFAMQNLKPYKKVESYSEYLARCYDSNREIDSEISYKMSDDYRIDLEKFFDEYENQCFFPEGIALRGQSISRNKLSKLFLEKYRRAPLKKRIELIAKQVCHEMNVPQSKYYVEVKDHLLESSKIELNFSVLYDMFLKKYVSNEAKFPESDKKIKYEDLASLLFLKFKVLGIPSCDNVKHVVIDEVQDYTNFQLEIIKKTFQKANFTLLGDHNQIINPYYDYNSLSKISNLYDDSKYMELTKSYRSSDEIIQYSNKILGLDNVVAIRMQKDDEVELADLQNEQESGLIINKIEELQEQGMERIGIITKGIKQAKATYDQIIKNEKYALDTQLITVDAKNINKSIAILPSYLSKGLEFEGVIIYNDYDDPYTSAEKKLYYVVCTRAQHKLSIYNEPQNIKKKGFEKIKERVV